MKNLAYVIPSGVAFLQHHLSLAVAAAGEYRVHLILPQASESCGETAARYGMTVHDLELSRKSGNPVRALWEAKQLRRLLKRIRPDLINAINLKAVLVSALANAGSAVPLVGTIPGLGYMFAGNTPRQRLLRNAATLALRHALFRQRHILVMSNRDDVWELTGRRVTGENNFRIVPVPGVDTEEIFTLLPEPRSGFRVVLPARMLREKGVTEFVEAGRRLGGKIANAEFILAGEPDPGNPSSLDRRQLEAWADEGAVSWLGHCPDMPGLLASCHVVCLPSSYREGFPRVLAEAMACGRAVVTTDTPGCREVGEAAGIIVPPGDVDKLTGAILWLHEHPEERQNMGRAGRGQAVAEFDVQAINEKILACYRQCLLVDF